MTSRSKKNKAADNGSCDTPQIRMAEIIHKLAGTLVDMKEGLDKDNCIMTEELADLTSLSGELIWMAGAVYATQILAADNNSRIIH